MCTYSTFKSLMIKIPQYSIMVSMFIFINATLLIAQIAHLEH